MIRWNEVTWYSKLGALVLFIGILPTLSFYIGMQYGQLTSQTLVATKIPLLLDRVEKIPTTLKVFQIVVGGKSYDSEYSTDGTSVFFHDQKTTSSAKVIGADIATFKALDGVGRWAKDKNAVYNHGVKLQEADPATFTTLCLGFYGEDTTHVYGTLGSLMPSTTPQTFRIPASMGTCSIQ